MSSILNWYEGKVFFMPLLSFAERLDFAMKEAKIDQVALAKAIGISKSAVNQILRGSVKGMKPAHLIFACRRLHIRPEWLALGEEPMRPDIITSADRAFFTALQALPLSKRETVYSVVRDLSSSYLASEKTSSKFS